MNNHSPSNGKLPRRKLVAINAANLHTGGAIQVAVSFIDELLGIDVDDFEIHIYVSDEVDNNLKSINSMARTQRNYKVANTYGISALRSSLNEKLKDFDLVFTIFGPNYLRIQHGIQLVGFAQAWIITKNIQNTLSALPAFKNRVKFFLQRLFFMRADRLIVELDHVREGLVREGIANRESVDVVHNCISSVYLDPFSWEDLSKPITKRTFSIGFLGRDYPHKNTALLPEVRRCLMHKHGLKVDFFVTFNDAEWAAKPEAFKTSVINVGPLSVAQCPRYYHAMDAVIFPSLLECFSATPLEALAMQKPLFASDRIFVREVCGNFAFYFDPLDAESAADVISEYITLCHGKDQQRLSTARDHAINFSSSRQRALSYLKIIRGILAEEA